MFKHPSRLVLSILPFVVVMLFYLFGILSASPGNTSPADTWCKEDINGDGRTNIIDVISLLLFGRGNPIDPIADYNGDGSHTISDAVELLLNIIQDKLTPLEVVVEPVEIDDFLLNPFRGFESKHCFNDWIGRGVPGHPAIDFFDVGSIGRWGEWH